MRNIFRSFVVLSALVLAVAAVASPVGAAPPPKTQVSFSPASYSIAEDGGDVTLVLTRSGNTAPITNFTYETHNGTAASGSDYAGTGACCVAGSFGPGEKTKVITISVLEDSVEEVNETFAVHVHGVSNADSSPASLKKNGHTGTVTIIDNDPAGELNINDPAGVIESGGSIVFNVTLTLGGPQKQPVSVHYATSNGSAVAPGDYTANSGTLTWAVGDPATKTVPVSLVNDITDEDNEIFHVSLSSPVNATIGDGSGDGYIIDDDGEPELSVDDPSESEGSGPLTFTVSLAPVSEKIVAVAYTTGPVGANPATEDPGSCPGGDYEDASGTLSFAPGETTKTVDVTLCNDSADEVNETLRLHLDLPSNATIADANGIGTIEDDDLGGTLSMSDTSVGESDGPLVFGVTLSGSHVATVGVHYEVKSVGGDTAEGAAACGAGIDFETSSGDLAFPSGDHFEAISIPICSDSATELDETFRVVLSSPVNADLAGGDDTSFVTIEDDDGVTLSVGDASANEDSGTLDFTVTLSAAAGSTVTAEFDFVAGTADGASDCVSFAADDYIDPTGLPDGSVSFTAGDTSETLSVSLCADTDVEFDETFTVDVTGITGPATELDGVGAGTIVNDDNSTMTFSPSNQAAPYTHTEEGGRITNISIFDCITECKAQLVAANSPASFTAPGATSFDLIQYTITGTNGTATWTATPGGATDVHSAAGTFVMPAGFTGLTSASLAVTPTHTVRFDNIVFRIH